MTNKEWRVFLQTARRVLGKGANVAWASESWCAWTTFTSLENSLVYWARGLPDELELMEERTLDGGLWMQSFYYSDLAHLIIPAKFAWEKVTDIGFQQGANHQNIVRLSGELSAAQIPHRITERMLEVKLY